MKKKRSASSSRWLQEHFKDEFVLAAQKQGWRSRAVFKLIEMDEKDKLFKPGMLVVDLGAAPGSWSEYAVKKVKPNGKVIALDILPIEPLTDVDFIQGDFTEDEPLEALKALIQDKKVDIVMSDIAPNLSGNKMIDQPRVMYLAELALTFAQEHLKPQGKFLIKLFQGSEFESYVKQLRETFKTLAIKKPKASRGRSREVYLLAQGLK